VAVEGLIRLLRHIPRLLNRETLRMPQRTVGRSTLIDHRI
jgi:hypothetical protein